MLFYDIDNPTSSEIKNWMLKNNFSINEASVGLGISRRQFSRFLSGETKAKKVHALAMQMIWLINEDKKGIIKKSETEKTKVKKISIPIK